MMIFGMGTVAQNSTVDDLKKKLKTAKEDTNKVILLNDLCWELPPIDSASCIRYGEEAMALAKKLHYFTGSIDAKRFIGRAYNFFGDGKKSINYLSQAMEEATAHNDKPSLATTYNELGTTYERMSNYDMALHYYYKALRIFEELNNSEGIASVKLNIAFVYLYQDEYQEALEISKEVRQASRGGENEIILGVTYFISGLAYTNLEQPKMALNVYEHALKIYTDNGEMARTSEVLNSIGALHQELENFPKALEYYEKSLAIDDSLGNMANVAVSYANLAGIYAEMDDFEKSIEYYDKSIDIASNHGSLEMLMTTMMYFADIYYLDGKYKKAYDYRVRAWQIKDSIYTKDKSDQIIDIRERYDTEKKQKKINDLKKEKDALRTKSTLKTTILVSSVALLSLIILVILIYLKSRKSKENHRRIKLEQKALRAQMNPHFIFNSLNSIQRMFIEGNQDSANDYMSDFGSLLRIILENSGKSTIKLQDEIDTLKLYLDLEIMRTDGMIDYYIDIEEDLDLEGINVPPLIIQPFVENAIWHGILPTEEKGTITIQIRVHSPEMLVCTVVDDGIGIEVSKSQKKAEMHNSKGMTLTNERLGKVNSLIVEQLPLGGTKVTLLIPING
ncbi:MAG: tetratricopeptide (TPR) repeat protein [Crocinitomicaceae bacterium]|jgi:tetratricopeptide (TPR) repeat protein